MRNAPLRLAGRDTGVLRLVTAVTPVAVALTLLSAGLGSAQEAAGAAAQPGNAAPAYTAAQARRGKTTVINVCGVCHADTELAQRFADWSGGPASFFSFIHTSMPADNPGSLPPQTYADVVAYLMQANQWPAGDVTLTPESELLTTAQPAAQ